MCRYILRYLSLKLSLKGPAPALDHNTLTLSNRHHSTITYTLQLYTIPLSLPTLTTEKPDFGTHTHTLSLSSPICLFLFLHLSSCPWIDALCIFLCTFHLILSPQAPNILPRNIPNHMLTLLSASRRASSRRRCSTLCTPDLHDFHDTCINLKLCQPDGPRFENRRVARTCPLL